MARGDSNALYDCGSNCSGLDSWLDLQLTHILGCNKIHNASYHSLANRIIEHLHRHLKWALNAHNQIKWTEILHIVLLSLRSALKEDIKATCSQLVYDTTLRLPSDLVAYGSIDQTPNPTHVINLIQKIPKPCFHCPS
ncbi:transposon Tf2-9 polyprotein [Nephila pilipes]|uniref:Transposon Tf2-9 polyprotein n=1 Tax=Nephila pilipes TaxID=299642 RepID=A0A8X6MEZ1_NEPPI|nr:transposon Tf2-9 polyprotein [Nephila pilipes]